MPDLIEELITERPAGASILGRGDARIHLELLGGVDGREEDDDVLQAVVVVDAIQDKVVGLNGRVALTAIGIPPATCCPLTARYGSWSVSQRSVPGVTPGVSSARFMALTAVQRQFGDLLCPRSFRPDVASVVFTRDTAPVTSTVVVSAPAFRAKFSVRLVVTLNGKMPASEFESQVR